MDEGRSQDGATILKASGWDSPESCPLFHTRRAGEISCLTRAAGGQHVARLPLHWIMTAGDAEPFTNGIGPCRLGRVPEAITTVEIERKWLSRRHVARDDATVPHRGLFHVWFRDGGHPKSPVNGSRQVAPDVLGVPLEHVALSRVREERDQVVEATRQVATEGVRDLCRRSCQPKFAGSEQTRLAFCAQQARLVRQRLGKPVRLD